MESKPCYNPQSIFKVMENLSQVYSSYAHKMKKGKSPTPQNCLPKIFTHEQIDAAESLENLKTKI